MKLALTVLLMALMALPCWAQQVGNGLNNPPPLTALTGVVQPPNGGTGTSTVFTKGSVVFAGTSGIYSQDNANFFWDSTNHFLGIGTAIPAHSLDVVGTAKVSGTTTLSGDVSMASGSRLTWNADTTLRRKSANSIIIGAVDAASPSSQTIGVQNVVAGTTDGAGGALTITGSQGTGAGLGGSIILQTAPASSTGSAQNALATVLTLDSTRTATFTNSSSTTTAPVAAGPFEAVFTNTGTAANNYEDIGFVDSGGFLKGYMRWINTNHTDGSATWALGVSGNELATINAGGTWIYLNAMNAARFVPTGSTVATNGMYLSASNTLDFSTNSIKALEISSAQAVTMQGAILAPNLATSSAAQTGTVCWTTGTGNFTVDTTTTCLLSSRRFKKDIMPMTGKLDEIMALRPVTFQYKDSKMGTDRLSGLIAEDVASLDKTLVEFDPQGLPYKVRYDGLTPVLVKAMQELKADNDNLHHEISALKKGFLRRPNK